MLSVVIPTRNAEEGLARTLSSLVAAAAEGVVREVIVVDHASTDGTRIVADAAGCTLIDGPADWAGRVAAGVAAARRAPWFLILPPDVFLDGDWFREAASFVDRVERTGRTDDTVAVFRLAWDDFDWRARLAEHLVTLSQRLFGSPLREQGLLVARGRLERAVRAAGSGDHRALVAALGRPTRRVLRVEAVVLPPASGGASVPSAAGLAALALAAVGLPVGRDGLSTDR